jgi:hypothetical protein
MVPISILSRWTEVDAQAREVLKRFKLYLSSPGLCEQASAMANLAVH